MMDPQRAPQARSLHEARRNPSLEGPIIDAFVLPNTVRPGIFRRGLVWLAWLGIAGVAGLIMVYPRQSLIHALMFAKLINESFHEAFDAQPLKSNAKPPRKASPPGTVAQKGRPASGGSHQPPPAIMVNGESVRPAGIVIQGRTAPDGTPLPPEEPEETPAENSLSSAGLHRNTAALMALPADWPRSVALQGTPAVSLIERTSLSGRQYAMQTEHYEFQSDAQVGADVVREMARVFEATYELNKMLPLRLHPEPEKGRPRFVARLFSKDRDYFAAGGMPGSAGTYSRDQSCILVPISSMGVKMVNGRMQTERTENTETLIHEVTHQMMNTWLPLIPRWYAEGSADYIAMADYVHGRFFLNQMEDRLRRYLKRRGQGGDTFMMLRPAELMTLDAKSWSMALASNAGGASQNYASATLLTYYFYHLDGKGDAAGILKYLRAIERGAPEAEASATHLLRGRSMAKLESDVTDAFERRGIKVGTIARGRLAKE